MRVLRAVVGILTAGARLPALTGNRVLYCDGVPIALLAGGEARFLEKLTPEAEWSAPQRARAAAGARSPALPRLSALLAHAPAHRHSLPLAF